MVPFACQLKAFPGIVLRVIPQVFFCFFNGGVGMGDIAGALGTVNGFNFSDCRVEFRQVIAKDAEQLVEGGVGAVGDVKDS